MLLRLSTMHIVRDEAHTEPSSDSESTPVGPLAIIPLER